MIKQVEIYDMDGVLVDSLHRYRSRKVNGKQRINLHYWRMNENKCMNDKLTALVKHYKASLNNPEIYVIIATARVLKARDWQFISTILGTPNKVICRKSEEDTRSAVTLKATPIKQLLSLKQFSNVTRKHIYEDNKKNALMVAKAINGSYTYIKSNQGW